LHPIALINGQYTGNAAKAAALFLGTAGFEGCTISFGTTKTEGLSDSIMENAEGKKIKVSSKGGGGAHASAKNLVDAVNELKGRGDRKLAKRYADVISLIEQIGDAGQYDAPLLLGVEYKIISERDAEIIRKLKPLKPMNLKNLDKVPQLTLKLKKLARERNTDNPANVNLFFHLTAAVAFKAADVVNSDGRFSKAAADILNNGALVQVYTKAKEVGDVWELTGFDTIYPGTSVTAVKFSASKTYYSTGIKGNFTFKILRNGAKDVDDEKEQSTDSTAEEPKSDADLDAQIDNVANARVDMRPKRATKVDSAPKGTLGRARR